MSVPDIDFCHVAPKELLMKSYNLFNISSLPKRTYKDKYDEKLSLDVWSEFINSKQSAIEFYEKMHLWEDFNDYVKAKYPQYGLYVDGSTLTGFGVKNSDLDFCVLDTTSASTDRLRALRCLRELLNYLKQYEYIDNTELISANVPIINFRESKRDIKVDMNYNQVVNIRSTYLLACYAQVDWRVRPLVVVIRLWSKSQGINCPRFGTLSNYVLTLMVIHFLQCGVTPAVLPCLQNMFPNTFDPNKDIRNINFSDYDNFKSQLIHFCKQNDQSLGELFVEFFKYYNTFDFKNQLISVRKGNKERITYFDNHSKNFYMHVEDPYKRLNSATYLRNISNRLESYNKVKLAIEKTYKKLSSNVSLNDILTNQ